MCSNVYTKRPSNTEGISSNEEYIRIFCEECPARQGYCGNPSHGIECPEMERLRQALEWKDSQSGKSKISNLAHPVFFKRGGKTLNLVKNLLLSIEPGDTKKINFNEVNYNSLRTTASRLGRECGAWYKFRRNGESIIITRRENEN